MKKIIIGISGKKQSGKSTLADSLKEIFKSREKLLSVKIYGFAELIKKNICIDILGLDYNQCYGSDEDKNSLTFYTLNDFPNEIGFPSVGGFGGIDYMYKKRKEYMSARKLMQVVGTNIFRKCFGKDVWTKALFNKMNKEGFDVSIITDVRFPDEVEATISNNGYVIRLNRNIFPEDKHSSETSLDDYDFVSWGQRCCIVNNQNMKIQEKNQIVFSYIKKIMEDDKCR